MRPQFERVTFPAGCSIRVYKREIAEIPFEWHHHPEYELTLTMNSRGWRFIGDHIGPYASQDLVLIPPDMPHTWASTTTLDAARPHTAVVIWFTGEWALQVADVCPEFSSLRKLLKNSGSALKFCDSAAVHLQSRLADLLSTSPVRRVQAALATLAELASAEATPLATVQGGPADAPSDQAVQLNRILNLVHKRFTEPLRVAEICAAGNLSARSLHRLFLRHVGENLSHYLARLRVGRASMLLVDSHRSIGAIAGEAGFTNLANFNRQFRAARRMTPKEFRNYYLKHGRLPDPATAHDLTKRSPSLEANARRARF